MPKCDFNKVALHIEITLQQECFPMNLLYIFGTTFTKNTSGHLLLKMQCITCSKMQYTLQSRDKTHTKLLTKHFTTQLIFGYHHNQYI